MLVMASEQLWPNLHGFLHWNLRGGGVGALFIYHTGDEQRSHLPAQRLRELVRSIHPEVPVELVSAGGSMLPQDVRGAVLGLMDRQPGSRWILNAGGGTKLMTAAALPLAAREDSLVVYRELSGDWFEIIAEGGHYSARPLEVDETLADAIPVSRLVELQYPTPDGARWEYDAARPLDVPALTRAAAEAGWSWREAFSRSGLPAEKQSGFLFEEFIAGTLLEFGLSNTVINMELFSGEGNKLQEIDIVSSHAGKLFIFDCKLRGEEEEGERVSSLSSQIKDAATVRRQLGGLNAVCLMLRPNRRIEDNHKTLAAYSGVTLIGRNDFSRFFQIISETIGVPLTDNLARAQAIVEQMGGYFSPRYQYLPPGHNGESGEWVNLDSAILEEMTESGRAWSAFAWRGRLHLLWKLPGGASGDLIGRMRRLLEDFGRLEHGQSSLGGSYAYFIICPATRAGTWKRLRDFLAAWDGETV